MIPFWDSLHIRCRMIVRSQRGTAILTATLFGFKEDGIIVVSRNYLSEGV